MNSVQILHTFCSWFFHFKIISALLYDPVCHTSILAWFYLVCSFVLCEFLCFFYFLVFYFVSFTLKWFALAVAAVDVQLRAILLYKKCAKFYNFCATFNSAHDGQFCACRPILLQILHAPNSDIPNKMTVVVQMVWCYWVRLFNQWCRVHVDWISVIRKVLDMKKWDMKKNSQSFCWHWSQMLIKEYDVVSNDWYWTVSLPQWVSCVLMFDCLT